MFDVKVQAQLKMLLFISQLETKYMTTLKENTELQSRVEEDEDDIDSLTEKNRQIGKQVCVACCR